MKEQNKTSEKELNKMEISNLSVAEFKTLVIRVFNELSEDLNSIKKNQSEMKDTLTKMKNNLQGINSRVDKAKNPISNLEYKEEKQQTKTTQPEQQNEKIVPKYEDNVRSLWDNFKHTNIQIIGVLEGEEKEQEIENTLEKLMMKSFPNLAKEIDIQVQYAQRVPNKMNPKRPKPRHIIIKMQKVKDKERILKAAREGR